MAIAALLPRIAAGRCGYDHEAAPGAPEAVKVLIPASPFAHHAATITARTPRDADARPEKEVESTEWLGQ